MDRREFEARLGRDALLRRLERRYLRQLESGDMYGAAETELVIEKIQGEDDECEF